MVKPLGLETLSGKTLGALRRSGIYSLSELRASSDERLLALRGLGPACLAEINELLPQRRLLVTQNGLYSARRRIARATRPVNPDYSFGHGTTAPPEDTAERERRRSERLHATVALRLRRGLPPESWLVGVTRRYRATEEELIRVMQEERAKIMRRPKRVTKRQLSQRPSR